MGARVARMLRNFNLESRAHLELSRDKPRAAPRHPAPRHPAPGPEASDVAESIHGKNDPLLSLLKSVYVKSEDPAPSEAPKPAAAAHEEQQRRPLKFSLPGDLYGPGAVDVPRGKLSLVEALRALNSHKSQPATWTPEKLTQEYSLNPKDTKAILEFFTPFDVKIIPPQTERAKQIKGSP